MGAVISAVGSSALVYIVLRSRAELCPAAALALGVGIPHVNFQNFQRGFVLLMLLPPFFFFFFFITAALTSSF